MKLIGNTLYLDRKDIELSSISFRTAEKWSFKIKDPADRRCDLFPYEQMADKYKALVEEKFGDPYEYYSKTLVKQFLKTDKKAFDFYSTYKLSNGVGLPETHITKYTLAAQWLNLLVEMENQTKGFKAKYTITREQFWHAVTSVIATENIDLPGSERRLRPKVKEYQETGYECLIKGFGNTKSKKITDQGERWLIAKFGSPIEKLSIAVLYIQYNELACKKGWKILKSEETLRVFLNRPEIKKQWYGMRYGELKAKEKYGYTLKTEMPTFRDALWYSDGTKLNFYYKTTSGMAAKMQIYEVIDTYSECLLGYHAASSENYESQYMAYRNAVMYAQARRYELKYDNQGGHSKLKTGDFLKKIARISVNTQPYNGKSKTIENAFGRFQSQIMSRYWFFTGQNIDTKKEESKANMEFIMANQANLPTLEEVIKVYEQCRNEWNNAINNSIGMPRKAAYFSSVNPHHMPVDYLQMVDLFWITKEKTVTYYTSGITTDINKTTYEYEVLDADGMPNVEFRDLYIGQEFHIKYDPTDLSHVRLYIDKGNGLQFVAVAQPRLTVHRAKVDHTDNDPKLINDLLQIREKERIDSFIKSTQLMYDEGLLPEQNGLNSPLPKGISKKKIASALELAGLDDIIKVKTKKSKAKNQKDDGYGVLLKEKSNESPDFLDLW